MNNRTEWALAVLAKLRRAVIEDSADLKHHEIEAWGDLHEVIASSSKERIRNMMRKNMCVQYITSSELCSSNKPDQKALPVHPCSSSNCESSAQSPPPPQPQARPDLQTPRPSCLSSPISPCARTNCKRLRSSQKRWRRVAPGGAGAHAQASMLTSNFVDS